MCRKLQNDASDATALLMIAVQHATGVDLKKPPPTQTRIVSHARAVFCILATEHLNMGQVEIASHLQISQQAVSFLLNRTRIALATSKRLGWFHPRTIAPLIHTSYQTFLRIKQ